ncbi:MAG: 5'/3'-nucleotidase SurE [Pirellulales bacterium]|nr:5'/3'-nucleotidase SurE [Pirellulales bacterium]
MLILLTNDDGIYAPGLAAMERELRRLGEVRVVAPATEQSGVGHSITYLTPLIVKEVYINDVHWGWAVEGSPADCVKIGIAELCPRRPDLVVSGINGGVNAGINVLYSGTVAAAIEGAFFRVTSIAVSLEFDEHARFDKAARLARSVIEQILKNKGPEPQLYNLNIPTAALDAAPEVRVVPMDVAQYGERFERRTDPWGREYYWATGEPPPLAAEQETDLTAMSKGCVTVTPLDFNMTSPSALAQMRKWQFRVEKVDSDDGDARAPAFGPVVRTSRKKRRARADRDDNGPLPKPNDNDNSTSPTDETTSTGG